MILPHTSQALLAAGYNPQPLELAASRVFTHAVSATTGTIQQFWNAFVAAHRAMHPRDDQRQEAA